MQKINMQPPYCYKATIIKVKDGDTISADVDLGFFAFLRLTFRVARINTPELNAADPEVRLKAQAAKARLADLLADPAVMIRSFKPYATDKYGRWIAEILNSKNENVSDILLAEGLAEPYPKIL